MGDEAESTSKHYPCRYIAIQGQLNPNRYPFATRHVLESFLLEDEKGLITEPIEGPMLRQEAFGPFERVCYSPELQIIVIQICGRQKPRQSNLLFDIEIPLEISCEIVRCKVGAWNIKSTDRDHDGLLAPRCHLPEFQNQGVRNGFGEAEIVSDRADEVSAFAQN